jgi:hypothetical protein
MDENLYYAIVAAVLVILIPIVPKMVRVRIAALRWLRWNRLADIHEQGFNPIVIAVRVIMLALAVYLFVLAVK